MTTTTKNEPETPAKQGEETINLKVTHKIKRSRIADLLCTALDSAYGSSHGWIQKMKVERPPNPVKIMDCDDDHIYAYEIALQEGGRIIFTIEDHEPEKRRVLDLQSIERGLVIMSEKYPEHLRSFIDENEDADTGDVFLQCCLFGEIVFS